MGNCHTVPSRRGSNAKERLVGRSKSGSSKRRPPREDDLLAVPGRIFSNNSGGGGSGISSIFTQQGRKGVNQDCMILWEDFGADGSVFCGVFDGHGPHGHLVARKVRDALPLKLLALLPDGSAGAAGAGGFGCLSKQRRRRTRRPAGEGEVDGLPVPLSVLKEAFTRSYKAMDKELRSHPTLDCFCSGSTAVTLLRSGSNLFMANIGDSRAVLATKDSAGGDSMVAVQLTVDLKPDLPREAERIKKCKGRVFALQDEPEVPRVWLPFNDAPGLAMARAFGDFCLKDYGVISVPEFFHWALTDSDQFVVLASDGVWDVLSNKEVVDIVAASPRRSSAAKFLVDAAAREWKHKYPTSKMDDCAVVCLYLNSIEDSEPGAAEISTVDDCCNHVCSTSEQGEDAQSQEPTLDRNFTVRSSMGSSRIPIAGEESISCGAAEDQNWSGLEGVTRVNSIVQLPRFFGEKASA